MLASVLEHLPGIVYRWRYTVTGQWTLEFISAGCEPLTGRSPAVWLTEHKDTFMGWVHPEDYQNVVAQMTTAFHNRQPYCCMYRIVTAGQTVRWVQDQGSGVFSPAGALLFCEGFIGDITAEKQREQQLFSSVETERLQLLERVQQQQSAIIELSTHPAVSEGRLDEALPLIAETAAITLQLELVGIWKITPDGSELQFLAGHRLSSGILTHDEGLWVSQYPEYFAAMQEGFVLAVPNVRTDPRTAPLTEAYWDPMGVSSTLEAPIRLHGQIVGVVCHEHVGPCREWRADEITFARQIADLVAQALLNAHIRHRAEELAAITRISQKISAGLSLQQILDSIAQHAVELADADMSGVFTLRPDGDIILASYKLPAAYIQALQASGGALLYEGPIGRALRERHPVQICDTEDALDAALQRPMLQEGLRVLLIVPMVEEEEIIGGIMLARRQPWRFTEAEIDFIQALAHQSANAVANARLLELERTARKRAETLYRLTRSLITFANLPDLLETVVAGVVEALESPWVILATFADEPANIQYYVQGGADADPQIRLSFAELWGDVKKSYPHVETATLLTRECAVATTWPFCHRLAHYLGSAVVAPLYYHNRVMGILIALRPASKPVFNGHEVALLIAMANQTAAAVENFLLLDSLNREKQQLGLVCRLGQHLSSSLDVPEVCRMALEEICTALGPLHGLLFTIDTESDAMHLMAYMRYDAETIGALMQEFRMGHGLSGWVAQQRQTAVIDDVTTDPRWIPTSSTTDIRSALSLPLFSGDELLGVLTLASTQPAFFTPEYRWLVESTAATIAIAIYNARLFGKIQQRAREQECVSEIARTLNTLDVQRAFPMLTRGLSDLAACEYVILALYDAPRRVFTVLESTVPTLPAGSVLSLPADICTYLCDGQPHLTTDLDIPSAESLLRELQALGVRSRIIVPLIVGNELTGLLYAGSRQLLKPTQIPILQQIADMLAIALENDRLFRAEQRHREIAERLQATALVMNTLDLQKVLTLIMDQLESIFPYDSGSIQILEHDAMCVIATRNAPHAPIGMCYPLKDYPYNRRLAAGEVVIIKDTQQDAMGWIPFNKSFYMRSNLGVPLWVRDKVIGALTIDNRGLHTYTDEEIRVVRAFAQQAAIAIENARLYEAQRGQRELAEALAAAAATISSVLDFDQVLDTILDQVVRVVHGDIFNIILIEGETGRMIRWRGYEELGIAMPQSRENIPVMHYPSLVRMIEEGCPVVITNIENDPRWVKVAGQEKLKAYVAAPIRIAGKTEGFINVAGLNVGQFNAQDAERLQAFANHASIALQNARLFQQTRRYAEQLERRVYERTIELEAKNAWLEAILSGTSDGIIVTDSDGVIVDANRVAKKWLYHSLSAQDVERLRTLIRDLARRADAHPDAVIELTGLDLELRAAAILGQGNQGPAAVIAAHDVSYLKALDRMKSQFISNISHELRTPLTSIILYSSLLRQSPPGNRQRYFEALDREAERLSKLIEDILQISRIEGGQLELKRQLVDLNALTEMAVMSHRILAESRGLLLHYHNSGSAIMVSVDRDRFIQVINNLIENALNYTFKGGEVAVSTERRIKDNRYWGILTVKDTGMGIPEHECEHIFKRFFRGDKPQKLHIQGSGLGLAIVKEIVELHGGTVTVESEVDVGSTFTVWLPLLEP